MKLLNTIRDWLRGYTDDDIKAAVRKAEEHWLLPPGAIIQFTGPQMRALMGEGLMSLFWRVREMPGGYRLVNAKSHDDIGERSE